MRLSRRHFSVIFFLSGWFEIQSSDFKDSRPLFSKLRLFISKMPSQFKKILTTKIRNFHKKPVSQINVLNFMEQKHNPNANPITTERTSEFNEISDSIEKIDSQKFLSKVDSLLGDAMEIFIHHISIKDFAENWTCLDFARFRDISRREFLMKETINWNRMYESSLKLSRWVASQIVNTKNFVNRVLVYQKMIDVIMYLWDLGNLNATMCFWGALHTTSVARLRNTKNALSKRSLDLIESLTSRLSEVGNFAPLQVEIEQRVMRGDLVIPWLELLTKNRNMAAERNDYLPNEGKDPSEKRLINFEKMRGISEHIFKFDKIQINNLKYNLPETFTSHWNKYLENLPTFNDEELLNHSYICEPD